MLFPDSPDAEVEQIRIVETHGGIHLRMGVEGLTIRGFLRDSYFSALARPSCIDCYKDPHTCSEGRAV